MSSHSKLEIVRNVDLVDLKAPHTLREGWRCILREPLSRTPLILLGYRNQTVSHWILVDVMESRQIRALICDVAVPKLKPDFSARLIVPMIELLSGFHVKFPKKFRKRA